MKKLIFFILLLIGFQSYGQVSPPTKFTAINQRYNWIGGIFDSTLAMPIRDTVVDPVKVGEIRFRTADSTVYVSTSITVRPYWMKLKGYVPTGLGTGTVTSVGLSIDGSAILPSGTPVTGAGTIALNWQGDATDVVLGNGAYTPYGSLITGVTNPLYSTLGHTHTFSQITDGPTAVGALFNATGGINYNSLTRTFSLVGQSSQDGLISGGKVVWSGTGLVFDVTSATYVIGGVQYVSPAASITLDAADATYDRYDVIAVDITGNARKITGTPSASPVVPQIDPANDIYLTTIFIAAGATTPTLISNELVYDENVEWSHSTSGSITTNFANTTYAAHGTKSISATWSGTANLIFTNGSTLLTNNYSTVSFYLRLVSTMSSNANISIQFYNGSTPVSNQIITYIGKGLTGTWQLVTLNVSDFIFSSSSFNSVRLVLTGANTSNPAYFDYVRLQTGVQQPQQQAGLQSAYTKLTDGTNTATSTGSDVIKFRTDNTLSVVVADNDATHGDNVQFKVDTAVIATNHRVDSIVAASGAAYKEYGALISQSSTSDPTVTVLGNTLSGSITWTRTGAGTYLGTLTGEFGTTPGKVIGLIQQGISYAAQIAFRWVDADTVEIKTAFGGVPSDDALTNCSLLIRVYN